MEVSLNFNICTIAKELFWGSWFGKLCWNLHTCIWKSSLISKELQNVTREEARNGQESLITDIFNRCGFSGTSQADSKKRAIWDGLQKIISSEPTPPELLQFKELIEELDRVDLHQENYEGVVSQLGKKYPGFANEELWNLVFLKLEKGTLRDFQIEGQPLHELLKTEQGRAAAKRSISQELFDQNRVAAIGNRPAPNLPPVHLDPPLPSVPIQSLHPDHQDVPRLPSSPLIENYKRAIHAQFPHEEAENMIADIEREAVRNPSQLGYDIQLRQEFYYKERIKQHEPKQLTSFQDSVGAESAKAMIKLIIWSVFPENPDLGATITDKLIPPNVVGFEVTDLTEVGLVTDTKTLMTTDFVIKLSENQSTIIGDQGRKYLCKDFDLFSRIAAGATLKMVSIQSAKEIRGRIDHKKKKIIFEPGCLKGSMAGQERSVTEVSCLEDSSVRITLTPTSANREPVIQDWTEEDFRQTFIDLSWPIKGPSAFNHQSQFREQPRSEQKQAPLPQSPEDDEPVYVPQSMKPSAPA